MKYILSIVFASLLFCEVKAQVPGTLSYQGILVTNLGAPAADGNHTVSFNFYKVASSGVPLFARGPFTVTTYKGMFTFLLGTGTPTGNDPLPTLSTDPDYIGSSQFYVELVADNVILTPRVQLSSVPYAFSAQNASKMDAAGLTGTANLPNTVLDTDLQDLADGSLSGSMVGSGISATNITTGTLGGSLVGTGVSATNITAGTLNGSLVGTGISAANITSGDLNLATSKFTVNGTSGNITKLNNVATAFPSVQGAANSLLSNDGAGTLTWATTLSLGGGKLLTDGSGNITKLNNVLTSFPSAQGAASSFLSNNGSGTLSWATTLAGAQVASGISATNITTGTLSGSLVGSGINASNITVGSLNGSLIGSGIIGGVTSISTNGYIFAAPSTGYAVQAIGNNTSGLFANSPNFSAIYAYSQNDVGLFCQTGNAGSFAAKFSGGLGICANGFVGCSDFRYKKNIETIKSSLDKILHLRGVSFDWRMDEFPKKNFSKVHQIGVIAQEVKNILPEVVVEDNEGYYSVAYDKIVPVLIEAIKEQQTQIEDLKSTNLQLASQLRQVDSLSAKVEELKSLIMGKEASGTRGSKLISTGSNKGK